MATWIIHQMDTDSDGLVLRARYRVEGPDMQNYECHAAEQAFARGDTFIPYDQLTEVQIIGWIKDKLGTNAVAEIEQRVEKKLVYIPPLETSALPW
jgi:hypothetical protein